jgi:antirestriction protein ArdC
MKTNLKPLQEQIAEKLIAALQAGTSPFQKPWTDDNSSGYITPLNPTTGKNYRGMNAFWLAMQDHDDPRWMTFKQAAANQWSVEKGAKATMISFVKPNEMRPLVDEKGEPVLAEGKQAAEAAKWHRPLVVNAFVFNADQIKGIREYKQGLVEERAQQQWSPIQRAEQIILSSQAVIKHGGNEAYYARSKDRIQLPKKEQFDAAAKYYATLLHELGHWSGHENRLNRDLSGRFGTADYAKEELRAEIASLMMGSELNIGHNFGQHAAYVESWIKILRNDPAELFKASADAQRITDFLLDFERKIELSVEPVQIDADKPIIGEIIPYKNTSYKILNELKKDSWVIQDTATGTKIKVQVQDGLYASLVLARRQALDRSGSLAWATEDLLEGRGCE